MKSIVSYYVILVSCVIFFVTHCTPTDKAKTQKIDQLMTECYQKGIFNGNVLVANNGKILYKKLFGYRDFVTRDTLRLNSPFYLASVSKQFTAMSIMILKQRNKLTYEDKLSDYFPEFPPYAGQVTIRHLLTHTSGVANHFRLGSYKPDLTNREVLEILVKQDTLDFKPGEKYSYSNGGYVLLAMIAEKAAGMPFHEFMKKNIFMPLGMDYSLVYDESKPKIPFRAVGYDMFGEINDYDILTSGAGGIFSTVEDLYKWDRALYTEQLVKRQTINEAFEPYRLNNDELSWYGFGWGIKNEKSGKIVQHGGALSGYRSYIERQLDTKNTIILLTNFGSAISMDKLSTALADILNDKPYQVPLKPISMEMQKIITAKGIDQAINHYNNLKDKNSGDYDFGEQHLNNLGYYYLNKKRITDAIEIFKLNVKAYPESFNPYDSLGEAYMHNSQYDLAIKNYKKSIELNPDNTNAIVMLKKINGKIGSNDI